MTHEDLGAIYDYLRTIKPVHHSANRFTPDKRMKICCLWVAGKTLRVGKTGKYFSEKVWISQIHSANFI